MEISVQNLSLEENNVLAQVKDYLGLSVTDGGKKIFAVKGGDGLELKVSDKEIGIRYTDLPAFARALGLLAERKDEAAYEYSEKRYFKKFGVMIDQSRNGVMTVSALKKYAFHMALLGYNRLMLYIEDIYEVPEEPYFGQYRGRYTAEEIREIESYCDIFGMELVPCIQTLAHLNAPMKWWWYAGQIRDQNDVLLIGEEKTYEFLDHCLKSISKLFRSRNVNVGMDEAFGMGLGKYYELHGMRERIDIFSEHVSRVIEICRKYGLNPMMWSDMFYKIAYGGLHYDTTRELTEEYAKKIPEGIGLIYWDYSTTDFAVYDRVLKGHKKFGNPVIFAGGAMEAAGLVAFNKHSFHATLPSCKACIENGIEDVMVTIWGDNGQEPSRYAVMPAVVLWAELAYGGKYDEDVLRRRFKVCLHSSFDDFMMLDTPAEVYDIAKKKEPIFNSSFKYLFYNDPLLGLFDSLVVSGEYNRYYKKYAENIRTAARRNKEFAYVFETIADMCSVLEIKCDLGVRLKKSYDAGDREGLKNILEKDLPLLNRRLANFYKSVRRQWGAENKIFGFEVQDIRIGGLQKRLKTLEERLRGYLEGKENSLPELEQPRVHYTGGPEDTDETRNTIMTFWNLMPTTGVL